MKDRYHNTSLEAPYLRSLRWNTSTSVPAKCFLGYTSTTCARGSCAARREQFVLTISRRTSLTDELTELAVLIDDPSAHPEPSIEQLSKWSAEKQEDIKKQMALAEAKATKESRLTNGRATSEEALQKRRAREEKRLAHAAEAPESDSIAESPAEQNIYSTSMSHTVVIPAASSSLEWYKPDAHVYTTIEIAKEVGVWDYPSTLQERARCGVFRDLWEQGYFMGGGIKFGGDYLVYPGIPCIYFISSHT